jgi:hypothetical protein
LLPTPPRQATPRGLLPTRESGPVLNRDQQPGKEIQLRYDRRRQDTTAVIIYHKGQRLGQARLLDAVANGLARRKEQP